VTARDHSPVPGHQAAHGRRAARADAGCRAGGGEALLRVQYRLTNRDLILLGWLADHGVLTTDQIAHALYLSLDFAQRRLLKLTQSGLLPVPAGRPRRTLHPRAGQAPGRGPARRTASFDDYAARIKGLGSFLSEDDRSLLATVYDAVSREYGPTSTRLRSVDRFARTLAAAHLNQA
jgi:predicted ArsR family transcriptional regulator